MSQSSPLRTLASVLLEAILRRSILSEIVRNPAQAKRLFALFYVSPIFTFSSDDEISIGILYPFVSVTSISLDFLQTPIFLRSL